MHFIKNYLNDTKIIIDKLDLVEIEKVIKLLILQKINKGRIFFLGNGGSAANCSHAVNDFRKILNIECYAPTDNISEFTARANDDGLNSVFSKWLETSNLSQNDMLFILSVGGGNINKNVSINLVEAIKLGKSTGCKIIGIVGRDGGYTNEVADACIKIPTQNIETVTPHAEEFQSIIWHLIVSHPKFKENKTKWESMIDN
jgi:D-sedoheptulose 7-phosphate isomerase